MMGEIWINPPGILYAVSYVLAAVGFTFLKKNSISINNIDSIDKTYITDEINEEDILNGVGYIEIDGYKVYLVNYYQVNINQSSNLENTIFICNGDINIILINDINFKIINII